MTRSVFLTINLLKKLEKNQTENGILSTLDIFDLLKVVTQLDVMQTILQNVLNQSQSANPATAQDKEIGKKIVKNIINYAPTEMLYSLALKYPSTLKDTFEKREKTFLPHDFYSINYFDFIFDRKAKCWELMDLNKQKLENYFKDAQHFFPTLEELNTIPDLQITHEKKL